jgi:hypothetical protein
MFDIEEKFDFFAQVLNILRKLALDLNNFGRILGG